MRVSILITAAVLALCAAGSRTADAQFRPGSYPLPGICNDDRLTSEEMKTCKKMMREASNSEERDKVKQTVRDRINLRQKALDEQMRKNSDPLSSNSGGGSAAPR